MLLRRSRWLYIAPRYSGASPFDTRPRRDADQNRQVLDADRALVLAGAAGRALPEDLLGVDLGELLVALAREQRLLRLQDDRLRVQLLAGAPRRTVHLAAAALDARERVEHRLAAEILTVSSPTSSFSKSRFGRLPSTGDFRKTVIGESTRWKCFDAGISARNARITSTCAHQLTRPASVSSASPNVSRNVDHQRRDEQRDDDRFRRYRCAQPDGRTNARRNEQVEDADKDADRKRRERDTVRLEPARVRQIDDAEAVQELDGRVAPNATKPQNTSACARPATGRSLIVCRCSRTSTRKRCDAERGDGRSRSCSGAAAIRRTRVATCAANAPTKATTSSQRTRVATGRFHDSRTR